jgi:hypothetical protein
MSNYKKLKSEPMKISRLCSFNFRGVFLLKTVASDQSMEDLAQD